MRRTIIALLVTPLILAGCTYGVGVDEYPTTSGAAKDCDALYADLPPKVAGQDSQDVKDTIAAAWGDPPIIMRCAVEKPTTLKPTSRCDMVDNVGWFSEKTADGFLFTTIGRQFYISVEVPHNYDPAADALVDLGTSVIKHDPQVKPCS